MKVRTFWVAPVCASLIGCGSPQDYSKTRLSDDSTATSINIGLGVKKEHAIWANTLVRSVYESRRLWEAGYADSALNLTDALLIVGGELFDSLPRDDDRSKFLSVLLVDLHRQGITWQRMRGDTLAARVRGERFHELESVLGLDSTAPASSP